MLQLKLHNNHRRKIKCTFELLHCSLSPPFNTDMTQRSIDDGCSHSLHMQLSKPLHAACACTRNIRALGPHSPCALHFLLHKHVPEKDVTSYIAAMCCMHSLFAHRLFILCPALSLLTLSSTDLLHARFTVNKLP
jgi:hypothetical protein